MLVAIITTLILAFMGAALKVSIDTGNWWLAFPATWAAIAYGVWCLGADADRDAMRRFWHRVTLR